MKKKMIVLLGSIFAWSPLVALAQGVQVTNLPTCTGGAFGSTDIKSVLCKITDILGAVVPVLIALGIVYFVWGVVSYVIGSDEEAKKKGRDRIIYGIIGLAVIVAVWGLVRILVNTFVPSGNTGNVTLPTIGR